MRIYRWLLTVCASLGLVACQDPEDGPRHLTPEEIEKYKQEQTLKIDKYVEYRKGTCPIILTDPHGGTIVESFLTLRNTGSEAADLSGWYVVSERGMDIYVLPEGTVLAAGAGLTVGTRTTKEDTDLLWPDKNVWHDSKDDPAGLYDVYGRLISHID